MSVYVGNVESVEDEYAGGRIKARIPSIDRNKSLEDIPFAFPLLPKMLHVKPQVGEAVLILFFSDLRKFGGQRFYVGPIISQPQYMSKDSYLFGATSLFSGSLGIPSRSVDNNGDVNGAFAKDNEIAIYGRENSDVIMGNNDIRIRCGVRITNPVKKNDIAFNRDNPSFIKLKYHENGLDNPANPQYFAKTSATVVADEINLIPNCGEPYFNLYNADEQIDDETMQKIINEAHVLPYGDVLLDFLMKFLSMFKNHTHKFSNLQPCPDDYSKAFDAAYGYAPSKTANDGSYTKLATGRVVEDVSKTFQGLGDKLLSKHVRIS